jgi:hypothetical protein
MVMRYKWGLAIGHTYAHKSTQEVSIRERIEGSRTDPVARHADIPAINAGDDGSRQAKTISQVPEDSNISSNSPRCGFDELSESEDDSVPDILYHSDDDDDELYSDSEFYQREEMYY